MRIHKVTKARKDQGTCGSCHQPIVAGDGYRYIAPRYGPKKKRHLTCPSFRPSEMTSSKIATAYAAQEAGHDALDAIDISEVTTTEAATALVDEVKQILADVATGVEECRDDYQDGYDNMPENFQSGPTGEEIMEKIDTLDSYANELEGFDPSAEVPDDDADPEEFETFINDVLDEARTAIDGLEL